MFFYRCRTMRIQICRIERGFSSVQQYSTSKLVFMPFWRRFRSLIPAVLHVIAGSSFDYVENSKISVDRWLCQKSRICCQLLFAKPRHAGFVPESCYYSVPACLTIRRQQGSRRLAPSLKAKNNPGEEKKASCAHDVCFFCFRCKPPITF